MSNLEQTKVGLEQTQSEYVAYEKLQYMHQFAKSSTFATILAPLLCIPIYLNNIQVWRFNLWFFIMTAVVIIRLYLIYKIDLKGIVQKNIRLLNWGVGITTLAWGLGWLLLVEDLTPLNYLIFEIISLTVLFVGMVGYCVNLSSFISFVLPLKVPEFIFLALYHQFVVWPVAIGSFITFYLAIKMAVLFSKSWEKSISLRFKNESLFNELRAERDISIAANIAKSDFIATASHDLRQPMQAINIYLELFGSNQIEKQFSSIVNKLKVSVEQLNRMFNALLDISKIDAQSIAVHNQIFSIAPLLNELEEVFQPIAAEKNISLSCLGPQIKVQGDKSLLQRILNNLISNAIQYTKAGYIEVKFLIVENHLEVTVRDTGCGISVEDSALIFKEFFRSENTRAMHDGLGLGLSIVNRLANLIDAKLKVESKVGVGTTIRIKTKFLVCTSADSDETDIAGHSNNSELSTESAQVENINGVHPSMHIAIIEDDPILLEAYNNLFITAGFIVHLIPVVHEELSNSLLDIDHLDFILSDFRLGEKNGVDFIQSIREEFNAEIPALLLTADTSPQHIQLFAELNIRVLYKPIKSTDILSYVGEFLSSKH